MSATIIRTDEVGQIARYTSDDGSFSFDYYLTPCCGADATGVSVTPSNPAGVACRACYQAIDPRLGGLPGGAQ